MMNVIMGFSNGRRASDKATSNLTVSRLSAARREFSAANAEDDGGGGIEAEEEELDHEAEQPKEQPEAIVAAITPVQSNHGILYQDPSPSGTSTY